MHPEGCGGMLKLPRRDSRFRNFRNPWPKVLRRGYEFSRNHVVVSGVKRVQSAQGREVLRF